MKISCTRESSIDETQLVYLELTSNGEFARFKVKNFQGERIAELPSIYLQTKKAKQTWKKILSEIGENLD